MVATICLTFPSASQKLICFNLPNSSWSPALHIWKPFSYGLTYLNGYNGMTDDSLITRLNPIWEQACQSVYLISSFPTKTFL